MTVPVTRVPFIYGGHYYVSTADLEGTRWKHFLPLYTRDGRRYDETRAGVLAAKRGQATILARENIGMPDIGS